MNYDDYQDFKNRAYGHLKSCYDCKHSERGCEKYIEEMAWAKKQYLGWIEAWANASTSTSSEKTN